MLLTLKPAKGCEYRTESRTQAAAVMLHKVCHIPHPTLKMPKIAKCVGMGPHTHKSWYTLRGAPSKSKPTHHRTIQLLRQRLRHNHVFWMFFGIAHPMPYLLIRCAAKVPKLRIWWRTVISPTAKNPKQATHLSVTLQWDSC